MATDIARLARLIEALRRETHKDSITPDSLGAILHQVAEHIDLLGGGAPLVVPSGRAQIECSVRDGSLYLYGSKRLIEAGFVPYLFRHTRKRNIDRRHLTSENRPSRGVMIKGWNLFGSCHTLRVGDDNLVEFSTNTSARIDQPADEYTSDCTALVRVHTSVDRPRERSVPWGKSMVKLWDKKHSCERIVRLRFAIGFAERARLGEKKISTLNLVTNLSEFSVVYNPGTESFVLSR